MNTKAEYDTKGLCEDRSGGTGRGWIHRVKNGVGGGGYRKQWMGWTKVENESN